MTKRIFPAIVAFALALPFATMVGCGGTEENTVIQHPEEEAEQAMEDYGDAMEADDAARSEG